jgi:hypothetical protein
MCLKVTQCLEWVRPIRPEENLYSTSAQREAYFNKIITAPKRGERNSRLEFHTSINKSNGRRRRASKRTVTDGRCGVLGVVVHQSPLSAHLPIMCSFPDPVTRRATLYPDEKLTGECSCFGALPQSLHPHVAYRATRDIAASIASACPLATRKTQRLGVDRLFKHTNWQTYTLWRLKRNSVLEIRWKPTILKAF